jgi:hypothetical protein
LSATKYIVSNFLQSPDEVICQVFIVLVELYRRSGVSLLDTATRILETLPPQRSCEVVVSGAGLCVDLTNRLRFWVYVGASCALVLVLVLMMVFLFSKFFVLEGHFQDEAFLC